MRFYKNIILTFVLLLFSISTFSQITPGGKTDNFSNFPFRLGAELSGSFKFKHSYKLLSPGFIGFLDINLSKRVTFLKLEGGVFSSSSNSESIGYASIGLNYKILNIKKNKFYLHAAVFAAGNKHDGGGIGYFFSLRYLYPFSKYFAIVSSIRYPFMGYDSFSLSFGFQLFAD